jgi:hypothetical protein
MYFNETKLNITIGDKMGNGTLAPKTYCIAVLNNDSIIRNGNNDTWKADTLAQLQSTVTNDFHNLGGIDKVNTSLDIWAVITNGTLWGMITNTTMATQAYVISTNTSSKLYCDNVMTTHETTFKHGNTTTEIRAVQLSNTTAEIKAAQNYWNNTNANFKDLNVSQTLYVNSSCTITGNATPCLIQTCGSSQIILCS